MSRKKHFTYCEEWHAVGKMKEEKTMVEDCKDLKTAKSFISRVWKLLKHTDNAYGQASEGQKRATTDSLDRYLVAIWAKTK